jgi:Icc-related predicted phosphoesterase
MRTARTVVALYDIHGNADALQAVLDEPDVAAADLIVIGGDLVPGPR